METDYNKIKFITAIQLQMKKQCCFIAPYTWQQVQE